MTKDFDIFISYSRNDTDKVLAFKDEIEGLFPDIKIWFDVDGIESGQEFISKITSAINRSKRVLFFVSDSSVASEWTRKEVMFAKNKNIPIIPILIQKGVLEDNDWYLFQIGSHNYIVYDEPKQKAKLLKDISRWVGAEMKESPESTDTEKPNLTSKDKQRKSSNKSRLRLICIKLGLIVMSLASLCGISFCKRVIGFARLRQKFGVSKSFTIMWENGLKYIAIGLLAILFFWVIPDRKRNFITYAYLFSLILSITLLLLYPYLWSLIVILVILGLASILYASENIFKDIRTCGYRMNHLYWRIFIGFMSLLYIVLVIYTRAL